MKRIKLFCFPYAGGAANVFNSWKRKMELGVDIIPVEYAGRGNRMNEPLHECMDDLVRDVYLCHKKQFNGDYAFFGHSMGALVAYELACKVSCELETIPRHLFVSGRRSPEMKREHNIHLLADDQFLYQLQEMGGNVNLLIDNHELKSLFLPILKSDFKILELHEASPNRKPLKIPFTVMSGSRDKLAMKADLERWKSFTSNECNQYELEGGHFFIEESESQVIELVRSKLLTIKGTN